MCLVCFAFHRLPCLHTTLAEINRNRLDQEVKQQLNVQLPATFKFWLETTSPECLYYPWPEIGGKMEASVKCAGFDGETRLPGILTEKRVFRQFLIEH